jgi:hypothetical protein
MKQIVSLCKFQKQHELKSNFSCYLFSGDFAKLGRDETQLFGMQNDFLAIRVCDRQINIRGSLKGKVFKVWSQFDVVTVSPIII